MLYTQTFSGSTGQEARLQITISSVAQDTLIQLPHQFVTEWSESLAVPGLKSLERDKDYTIDYRQGILHFNSVQIAGLFNQDSGHARNVEVTYRYLPLQFQQSYSRRKMVVLKDSTGRDSLRIAKPRASFGIDDIFGKDLQKSGSVVRGFSLGSNRDLSLNSGFRMQLAGKLAPDVDVVASLTDENTPIQPEGTTQTLQEFDKVFVELSSTNYGATLGDFNLEFQGTEFARLSRKLQGAKGTANYTTDAVRGGVVLSGAAPRGKFNTNPFKGIEGVQGPYRLTGRNNERNIIVIAGTERVYVNGEQQTRGETNDYTIDYSTGEVTFTPRRLVTSASRIVVDFEYTDRQFSRSLLAAQSSTQLFSDKAALTFSFFREADDPDAPIDFEITDSLKHVLQSAGNDRNKATVSGISRVDSNGLYVRVDTLLNGRQYEFYRFAPGDTAAHYLVVFSSVGFGKGEYVRQRAGEFEWKGPGGGEYLPVRFLPMPQSYQMLNMNLAVQPFDDLSITGEFGRSTFDGNRLSTFDDGNNGGHALNFTAAYAPKNVTLGGTNIGSFDLKLKERFVDGKFVSLDRTNDIEFTRKWGIDTLVVADEEMQEASLGYSPMNSLQVSTGYGKITRGETFRSVRNDGAVHVHAQGLPLMDYVIESVRSRERLSDNSSDWLRQRGTISQAIGRITGSFRYESENRNIAALSTSSIRPGSLRYGVYAPRVTLQDIWKLALSAEYEWRNDDLYNNAALRKESKSFTQAYSVKLGETDGFSTTTDLTFRKKKFTPEFKELGNSDVKSVLIRNQSRYMEPNRAVEADLFYQVSTERSSRLERVFIRVAQGTGNYRYLGDLNNDGLADENEFELTRYDGDFIATTLPTDQLFPVIDLKTSLRLRLSPKRWIETPANYAERLLSTLSSESYIRIDEKSSEPDLKQIYLLNLGRFRNDSTTIEGSILFTQDLNFLEGQPAFSGRLRYSQRKGFGRLSGGNERTYLRERSIRLRWQLVDEISNQLDYVIKDDRLAGIRSSTRVRDILSRAVSFDLSYRPQQNIEMGIKLDISQSTDRFAVPVMDADFNAQSLRCVYSLLGAGQLRAEVSREEVLLAASVTSFPYELTGGRVGGKTYLWRTSFDYRITDFVQATMNYDGRSEGGAPPVHTARAEVRAFF